jgi:hypothetical protein
VLDHVVLDGVDIEAILVVDGGVVFDNTDDFAAIFLEELGGPVSDGAETLDDKGLILDAGVV